MNNGTNICLPTQNSEEPNRINILGSRYVEVVTNQRIMWLEKIREDVSKIVGLTKLIFFNDELIRNFINIKLVQIWASTSIENNVNYNNLDDIKTKIAEKAITITDLLQVITKLKLRLNYKEDVDLLGVLTEIERGIVTKIEPDEMSCKLDSLVNLAQIMLKNEWEKVKKEVASGKEEKLISLYV